MEPPCFDDVAVARARRLRERYAADPVATLADVKAEMTRYLFYHIIEIAPGLETPGLAWARQYLEKFARAAATLDFKGKRILDVGCRDGAQAFCMEAAGASEIFGVDNDLSPALVNFLAPFMGSRIQCRELNLYELDHAGLGTFDIVSCLGVLYHLQFPFWGLKQLRDALRPGGRLIIETGVLEGLDDLPVAAYMTGETSPYEPTSPTFFNLAGLKQALGLLEFDNFVVHHTTPPHAIDVKRHFPAFHAANPGKAIGVNRTLMSCVRATKIRESYIRDYFEGLHRIHSTGEYR